MLYSKCVNVKWFIADQHQDPDSTSVSIANPDTTLEVKTEIVCRKNAAYC